MTETSLYILNLIIACNNNDKTKKIIKNYLSM